MGFFNRHYSIHVHLLFRFLKNFIKYCIRSADVHTINCISIYDKSLLIPTLSLIRIFFQSNHVFFYNPLTFIRKGM